MIRIWMLKWGPETLKLASRPELWIPNERQLRAAGAAAGVGPATEADPVRLPADFPAMQLRITRSDIAPDFLGLSYRLVSRKLRDALAQPEHVVQYLPVDATESHPNVQAQDYRVMRLLRRQTVLDISASDVEFRELPADDPVGPPIRLASFTRMAFLSHASTRYEIFTDTTERSTWLCTDPLAQRVLEAGCTGIEFVLPESDTPGGEEMIKTLDDLAPRWGRRRRRSRARK